MPEAIAVEADTGATLAAQRLWLHSRKGPIVGREVGGNETWLMIELAVDHRLVYGSEANRGRVDVKGEVVTVRRSLVTEVARPQDEGEGNE